MAAGVRLALYRFGHCQSNLSRQHLCFNNIVWLYVKLFRRLALPCTPWYHASALATPIAFGRLCQCMYHIHSNRWPCPNRRRRFIMNSWHTKMSETDDFFSPKIHVTMMNSPNMQIFSSLMMYRYLISNFKPIILYQSHVLLTPSEHLFEGIRYSQYMYTMTRTWNFPHYFHILW